MERPEGAEGQGWISLVSMSAVPNLSTLVAWPGTEGGAYKWSFAQEHKCLHSSTSARVSGASHMSACPSLAWPTFQQGWGPLISMVKTDWMGHHVKFCICLGKRKGGYPMGESR